MEDIDLYFDNVGGNVLDTVMGQQGEARLVLSGAIFKYEGPVELSPAMSCNQESIWRLHGDRPRRFPHDLR